MVKLQLKNVGEVRLMIAKTGKNLSTFSKHIGISQPYLSQVLNGEKFPSPITAGKISKGLGVNIEDIFLIETIDISI
jgi:transcriptional regulator with XRE-family HTH domain